jgi:hypothetical protein
VNKNKEVNILLVNSPHRHDLTSFTCVNREMLKLDRQVKKIMKIHSNVKLLEIDLDKKHFTRHVQHLNLCGKELTSLQLAVIIDQFCNKKSISCYSHSMERLLGRK